uniref:Uncharacterized protein n=1 Tax=Opuntia streptacantha TaxID=393608 RepID=A0A7C8YJ77_OPUST
MTLRPIGPCGSRRNRRRRKKGRRRRSPAGHPPQEKTDGSPESRRENYPCRRGSRRWCSLSGYTSVLARRRRQPPTRGNCRVCPCRLRRQTTSFSGRNSPLIHHFPLLLLLHQGNRSDPTFLSLNFFQFSL